MKIFLARAPGPPSRHSYVPELSRRLRQQREPRHHLEVDDPGDADVVLFAESHLLGSDWLALSASLRALAAEHAEKLVVYDERDMPWCRLPGVYVSMPARGFVPRWQVAGSYWNTEPVGQWFGAGAPAPVADLLFSFVGTRTHRCRDAIFSLPTRRAHIERVEGFMFWDNASPRFDERRRQFAEVTSRSKFVLCPRGHGTSSVRLYEVLSAGRVPVIIADDWVAPNGPDWERFSIRWPEPRVSELPALLERAEDDADEMGARALAAYKAWFAPDVVISRQLGQLEQLVNTPERRGFPPSGIRNTQYLRCAARAATGAWRAWRGKTRA